MRKFVTGFFVLLLVTVYGVPDEEERVLILSSGDSYARYRVSVPPDPIHDSQISESRQEAWTKVLEQCTPIDTHGAFSESCESALAKYFPAEPVWDNKMYYYDKLRGLEEMFRFASGLRYDRDRPSDLPYSPADFVDDYPVWRDIFDSNIERRIETFLEVTKIATCLSLSSTKSIGIQENLESPCAAKELYKYAAYLDACSTAMDRLDILNDEDIESLPWDDEYNPPSKYDLSIQFIKREIESSDDRKTAKRRMQKGYLLAYWTAQQCESHGYMLIPGLTVWHWRSPSQTKTSDQSILEWDRSWSWYDKRLLEQTYQNTMTIAAKSGHDWAIRAFDLRSSSGRTFRAELQLSYPILVHRWLGGSNGKTEFQRRHQAKAYLLLKEKAGEAIAQLEYDSVDLAAEIQYIEEGGELSFPSTWDQLPYANP